MTHPIADLGDVAPSIARSMGFSPEFGSEGKGSPNIAFHAWRGRSESIELESFDMPVIVYHVGGVASIPVRLGRNVRGTSHPGSISIIPAGTLAMWDVRGDVTSRSLCFKPELLATITEHLGQASSLGLVCGMRDATMTGVIDELERELRAPSQCGALYLESAIDFLVLHMLRRSSKAGPQPTGRVALSRRALARVLDLMNHGIEGGVSLEQLAREASLSRAYFAVAFKEATGISPHRYLTGLRVEHARHLLLATDLALSAIALRCGFCSQAHFCTTFRALTGTTPSRFRGRNGVE